MTTDYSSFGNYGLNQPAPQGDYLSQLLQTEQAQPTQAMNQSLQAMNQPFQMDYGFGTTPEIPTAPDSGFNFSMPSLQDAGTALKGAGSIGQVLLGFKQLSQAKKQAQFQRGMATTNLANQVKITRAQQADRQRTRVAGDTAGRYQSVADYMAQYGVSGSVA